MNMLSLDYFQASSPSTILQLFVFLFILVQVSCLQFSYLTFSKDDISNFILTGDASFSNGAMQITPGTANRDVSMRYQSGSILYNDTFKLWDKTGYATASFCTSFLLNIIRDEEPRCEGFAFILTSNPDLQIHNHGQWLGILNATTNGSALNQTLAFEIDTTKSHTADIHDNHVGREVNGTKSIRQSPSGKSGGNLSNGSDFLASIRYNDRSKCMDINVSMDDDIEQSRSMSIDLTKYLLEDVYVGISASTGEFTQLSIIKSWTFTSHVRPRDCKKKLRWVPALVLATFLSFIVFMGCFTWCLRDQYSKHKRRIYCKKIESMIGNSTSAPHKFRLKELKSATANFDPINKLGQGGFGTVYKGFLKKVEQEVAVKRLSKDSRRGEEDFIAEMTTISRLSHKNLVKLFGWCCERDELLLVYEFLPRGSLDKLIFTDEKATRGEEIVLSWEDRHKIICGVASALTYLHDGWEKRVLHCDVKSSNVMLDSEYNSRLGDFGLARIIPNKGRTHVSTSTIAGTPGYIAPECFQTGRVSAETDVYAFGVFALEVACGRRPGQHYNYIVDWVWDLYGREKVLDAADSRLHGVFDDEQMERVLMLGLVCCHRNPNERPSVGFALQVLAGEAALPALPAERPFIGPLLTKVEPHENFYSGGQLTVTIDVSGR